LIVIGRFAYDLTVMIKIFLRTKTFIVNRYMRAYILDLAGRDNIKSIQKV